MPVPGHFLAVTLKVVLHRTGGNLEKSGHLFLENDGLALEGDASDSSGLFDLSQCVGVVEDVLAIDVGFRQVFAHGGTGGMAGVAAG